ncbi:MAG: flavodoxin family protein [Eubacteriales bacterium]
MNVGIIVYSYTGNTLSVAQKLEHALNGRGHSTNIVMVEALKNDPRSSDPIKLKSNPDVSPYDIIVFASPVQAFSLARIMKLYLSQVSDLSDKKVYCFVTQRLKKRWLGGNHAVNQIKSACKEKGSDILLSGIVNWSSDSREEQIEDIINRLGSI